MWKWNDWLNALTEAELEPEGEQIHFKYVKRCEMISEINISFGTRRNKQTSTTVFHIMHGRFPTGTLIIIILAGMAIVFKTWLATS